MQFSAIHGLPEVKQHLIQSANTEQVAHAQLFLGPEGGPNLALALAYAQYLNCENRGEDGHCGDRSASHQQSKVEYAQPDVHFVFPVGSTKKITGKDVVSDSFITEWRTFLTERPYGSLADWSEYLGAENKSLNISKEESRNIIRKLSLTAFGDRYKIVIIWHPERMHPAAANGILKILEEPPDRTLFILVAHSTEQLLPTILSRTQIVQIRAFSDEEIIQMLVNHPATKEEVDRQRLRRIATLAEGNFQKALQLYQEVEDDSHQLFRDWMRLCYLQDYKKLLSFVDKFQKLGKENQKALFSYGLAMIREMLVHHSVDQLADYGEEDTLQKERKLMRVQGKDLEFVVNFSKIANAAVLEKMLYWFNEAYVQLERNANPKILLLDISLNVGRLIKRI
ncbi:ATP-binding protein [Tunicatimonas pelagia]|uniref:DNA polymerase III subunit n=1 Tax=Tunicatimonas pelagia TaxID=931531 RepID=UPI0026668125|nr:DNA polymerase III subunit delta [Tunicatimonas pelagia]WKN44710.1 DNA polymerase III subunit delta [Tunicatimonas pelagia]